MGSLTTFALARTRARSRKMTRPARAILLAGLACSPAVAVGAPAAAAANPLSMTLTANPNPAAFSSGGAAPGGNALAYTVNLGNRGAADATNATTQYELGITKSSATGGRQFGSALNVGDTLTGVSKVADIIEKEGGRGGKMTMLLMETEYTNQKNEKVAIARSTLIETGQAVKA